MKQFFTSLRSRILILLSVFCTLSYAQTGNLSGVVLSEKSEGLIGATVKLKGTSTGAACDLDGKYTIMNIPVGQQTFVISYIGFTPKEIVVSIKEGENIQPAIILKEDRMALNEVVVVGYGTQVKHDMSSAAAEVKAADLMDKPVYNFTSALAGEAAGVQVTTDNGVAGSNTTIRVRGTHTLSNSADPLYVIDGVPVISYDISNAGNDGYNVSPMSNINPSDIESIEILKDAAATAIYGARGANGVIIVTTKSGKSGKTKVDFSYNVGITNPAHEISLLNGPQYVKLYQEGYRNDSLAGLHPETFQQRFGFAPDSAHNTNWLNQVMHTGYFQEANVSTSGGTSDGKTTFYTGLGIRDEKTFLIGNTFQRISFRNNITHTASKNFDFGTNISLTRTENHYVATSFSGGLGSAQSNMLPIFPVYNPNGSFNTDGGSNPVAQILLDNQQNVTWRTIDNVFMNIHFLKNFTFHNELGADLIDQVEEFYYPTQVTEASAEAIDRRDEYFTYHYAGSLDYKKQFKQDHVFEAMAGFDATATIEKFSYIQAQGFSNPAFTQVQSADSIITATAGTGRQYDFASFYARFNYKYKNRYLFQLSARADGSSRFAPNNRFGYFPAGSFGWVISEEPFFKRQSAVTLLKFRASSGLVGNAEFTNDFAYFSTFSSGYNYAGQGGIAPTQTSVSNLSWESTLKNDIGTDFGFIEGRLSGLLDFYYDYTYNLLVQQYPLSPSSGYTSVSENRGTIRNDGTELQLTSYNIKSKSKFQWKTVLNFALNRSKVLDLGGVAQVDGTGPNRNRAVVGYPVGVYWLAQYAGVDPATGNPMIYDFDGHKVLATATSVETYSKPMGRPYPIFYGGLTNTFSYKGIELSILLTYSYGNEIYDDGGKYQSYTLSNYFNQTTNVLNRWQQAGDVTDIPKMSTINYDNLNMSEFLHDASYMKVKNLTLAYNLPQSVVAKMRMRNFRIFVSAQNLATVTSYKGWDPEYNRDNSGAITQGVNYLGTPQARAFSAGFNFGL